MLTTTATSTAPADLLWARVADVEAWPDHLDTFTTVRHVDGPRPTGVGTRFKVVQPGLRPGVYEVTAWTPGASFTWVARFTGVTATADHTVTDAGDGSRVELAVRWTGPLAPVVRLLMGRRTQRMIDLEAATFAELAAADARDAGDARG